MNLSNLRWRLLRTLANVRHAGISVRLTRLVKECALSVLRSPPKFKFLALVLALTLPAAIAMLSNSFSAAEQNLLLNRQITLFLDAAATDTEARTLTSNLIRNQAIDNAALSSVVARGKDIHTITLQPAVNLSTTQLDQSISELGNIPLVDFVDADIHWLQQNHSAIQTTKKLAMISLMVTTALAMLLAFAIACTELLPKRTENMALEQLGASQQLLLRPVLLRCMLLTSLAILAAVALAWIGMTRLPQLIDLSSYTQVLNDSVSFKPILMLILPALACTYVTTRIMGRRLTTSANYN